MFTVRETADLLGVTEQNIRKLVKSERLVLVQDNGRTCVSPSSLVKYIQERLYEIGTIRTRFEKALNKLQNPIDN